MNPSKLKEYEENPFNDEAVAKEWINSVENERELIRDTETYPLLKGWVENINPKLIVEIGSGQGICADKVQVGDNHYIGIEPSEYLVKRAQELYRNTNREFIVGNAYQLPLADETAGAVFSVNVWFHLEDLKTASKEMARILKSGGYFLISTANPDTYHIWESFYSEYTKDGKRIVGKVKIPVNPLSRNTFYKHTLEETQTALEVNGLKIEHIENFGDIKKFEDKGLFINIAGKK